ncbi:hypothetical protein QTP70_003217 [Hemibagrus guttatus]|uniref:G-protein coupled receptors family 1 profile domain-containing protein n=1 Tax=Hemibagrus guttatus TaxID=175788 RepID=A0AAE0Q6T0_9TELE|nr:hypothetical protein QTP70_003217 [Hemibagrus guttatus]
MQSPQVLHSVVTHLDNNNAHAYVLFVDFSSTFNTVIPSKLTTKLGDLGINTSLRNWIMDFLTNRPQHVRSGHICSTTITFNTGIPQCCVLSPFLYSLFTHEYRPVYGSNSIIKFSDDTTVIGLISDSDETAYMAEVQHLVAWCDDNNLLLNNSKAKELIIDFRREKGRMHDPIHINRMAVERVSSFKFLGTHISEYLSWTTNTSSLVKKAHQRLFYLNTLKKNHLSSTILVNFYRCAIESILTNCITVCMGVKESHSDWSSLEVFVPQNCTMGTTEFMFDYGPFDYANYTEYNETYDIIPMNESHSVHHSCFEEIPCMLLLVVNVIIILLGIVGNGVVIWIAGFKMKKTVNTTWFTSFVMFLNMFSSIFLLVIISVDRCIAVMFPVWAQNQRTIRKASLIVLLAWVLAVSLMIIFKLRSNQMAKSTKPFKIMTALIVTFFVCWLPYHTFVLAELTQILSNDIITIGFKIGTSVASANSFLNPILYVFMGNDFRKKVKNSNLSKIENAIGEEGRTMSRYLSRSNSVDARASTHI